MYGFFWWDSFKKELDKGYLILIIKKHLLLFGGVYEFGYELLGVRNSQSVSVIRPRSEITKVIPLNYTGLVIFGGFNLESIVVEILSFS